MPRPLVILAFCCALGLLQGCAEGLHNPFSNDPLTGGTDVTVSRLLGVPTPAGMQRFASHGYETAGTAGSEGLEVLRGDADPGFAAQIMYTGLQGQGWQLRLALRKGGRAVYVYERGQSQAVLTLHRETLGTVLEIWTGARLPDGAALPAQSAFTPSGTDAAGEAGSYNAAPGAGGMDTTPQPGATVRTWGGNNGGSGGLEERNL
ncbi:hypothetical protein [Desulfovibrio legallii]|jgi:hypothetical protein|uniref:Lipoprotein n=1 Tax=Desulfovibrio legallii TaxID=571438 RepID=A0A1G7R0Q3_9BACT|nr:hypothetical protein [Desulfovibrio legallii]SDG04307.1 hypothetical protein SAMN05192586_1269 [Desulfovibrio legallii]